MGLLERIGLRQSTDVERGSPGTSVVFPPESGFRSNWWQLGRTPPTQRTALNSSSVYSCVSVLSQEVARLHVRHWRRLPNGGREEIRTSSTATVMRRPNEYQSRSDFWMSVMTNLLLTGNAYAIAERNGAGQIIGLHPRNANTVQAKIDEATGAVFYSVGSSNLSPQTDSQIPARNVFHLRLFCPQDPLVGISPLQAASYSISHGEQLQLQSVAFWGNKARPAGVLTTDRPLSDAAAKRLRDQWQTGTSQDGVGKTAVLDSGITWQPLGLSPQDAAVIAQFNLTIDDVARIYRVPLYLVARMEGQTFNNVETQQRVFHASCLAFYLEAAEAALDDLFGFGPDEGLEFDVERGMMRSEFDRRVLAYKNGIQGGIYSPNECRKLEGLPPVPGGDDVFLQAQMQPVEVAADVAEQPAPDMAPTPPAAAEPEDDAERGDELEKALALQRMEFAAKLGSLEADLAEARAREVQE